MAQRDQAERRRIYGARKDPDSHMEEGIQDGRELPYRTGKRDSRKNIEGDTEYFRKK